MKPLSTAAILIVACQLASCTVPQSRPTVTGLVLDHHNFDYAIADREGVRLIQAFDDGSKTYLQFTRAPSEPLIIVAGAGAPPLAYIGTGPYIVVPGVYPHLAVSVGAHSADITNHAATASLTPPTAATAVVASDDSTRAASIAAEVDALQARIRELQSELDAAHAAGRAATVSIDSGDKVVIRFGNNSSVVDIDDELLQTLGVSAAAAQRVTLHGRTDAYTLTGLGAELAIARAVAVKELLVAQGVDGARIRIFYRGAGAFAVDNATRAGKAANRRVEIQMIKG